MASDALRRLDETILMINVKKRTVVIFTNTLLSGGAEKQAMLLAIHLKTDHNVILVVYYGNKVEEKFSTLIRRHQIDVNYLHGNHIQKAYAFFRLLRKYHVFVIFSYLLTTNLAGAVIGKLAGVPVRVGGIRNAKLDKNKIAIQRLINNRLSTHTIFNNHEGVTELAKEGFSMKNAVVIPNCFELTTEMVRREPKEVIEIITVGRFVAQKGYFEALSIMEGLKNEGLCFRYFMIGFGELEQELRQEIARLNLQDVVEMVINPPNLPDYYLRSDIYLCTSYFEGLSNTIMEALSYSLPVVATDVGDNKRLVNDGVNGFILPDCKQQVFMNPLKKLMASAQLRNDFGEQSFRIIRDNYSASAFRENYNHFIAGFDDHP